MILNQVRSYSNINEKINRDLQAERKSKTDVVKIMKEKIEQYKSDSAKAISRCNSYKARTETFEQKYNELLTNCQKVEEQSNILQLNLEKKNEEIQRQQNELVRIQEKYKCVGFNIIIFKNVVIFEIFSY